MGRILIKDLQERIKDLEYTKDILIKEQIDFKNECISRVMKLEKYKEKLKNLRYEIIDNGFQLDKIEWTQDIWNKEKYRKEQVIKLNDGNLPLLKALVIGGIDE